MADTNQITDSDLVDSIAMLEQILEVMPQDATTLKAIYNAYMQGGVPEQAFIYLGRLAEVAAGANDPEFSMYVVDELMRFEASYPEETSAYLTRLRMNSSMVDAASVKPRPAEARRQRAEADIGEELSLAWRLYEENQLSQDEYSSVLNDLTDVSTKQLDVPISVLHVLHDRGFNQMNRIVNYLSGRSGTPFIKLADFNFPDGITGLLPMDVVVHEGALPFGFFGDAVLVALLNPFKSTLIDSLDHLSGRRCYTYLVMPDDYDAALARYRALLEG